MHNNLTSNVHIIGSWLMPFKYWHLHSAYKSHIQRLMQILKRMLTCFKSKVTKWNWRCDYFLAPIPKVMVSWPQSGITRIKMSRFHVKGVNVKWAWGVREEKETRCCKLCERNWIKLTQDFLPEFGNEKS